MNILLTSDARDRGRKSLVVIGVGGTLMAVSMFFRYMYGPWAFPMRLFDILRNNLSWDGLHMLIAIWPIAFGLVEAVFATLAYFGRGWAVDRVHWVILAGFLFSVAVTQLGLLWWHRGIDGFQHADTLRVTLPAAGTLFALSIALSVMRSADRRSAATRLLGAVWVLVTLHPISDWTPLRTILWAYGLGYWMLLGGTLCLAAGSVRQLLTSYPHTGSPN